MDKYHATYVRTQIHNHYTTAKAIYSVAQEREIEGMLLMKANKPETALYRAPTFSLSASRGGLVHRVNIHT